MAFIELKNVSLDIPVFDSSRSFRRALFNRYTGGYITNNAQSNRLSVRALENINLRLEDGDKIGLIGHNGAGKTSLLRVLAGLYEPEVGTIRWEGAITPLFNTALGMDMDDTGLENIKTIGMYLGMTPEEIEAKTPDIVEFSELGDFISLPVRTYSSGMSVRLSFAIATALDPEILLLDEGIGAGDARFAERAKKRLESFYKKLTILVLASHSDTMIQELCNKALLLEHGRVKAFGDVNEVIEVYHRG